MKTVIVVNNPFDKFFRYCNLITYLKICDYFLNIRKIEYDLT